MCFLRLVFPLLACPTPDLLLASSSSAFWSQFQCHLKEVVPQNFMAENNHFIMLTDFLGQGKVQKAYLCSMTSGEDLKI